MGFTIDCIDTIWVYIVGLMSILWFSLAKNERKRKMGTLVQCTISDFMALGFPMTVKFGVVYQNISCWGVNDVLATIERKFAHRLFILASLLVFMMGFGFYVCCCDPFRGIFWLYMAFVGWQY
jgi:hypothetical protein